MMVVPEKNEAYLNEKQRVDYEAHRRRFIQWLRAFGKDPKAAEGYSEDTVSRTVRRCGKFDRFVWERDGYTVPTHTHANAYMTQLATRKYSGSHRKNTQDSLKRYFRWREQAHGTDPWEPEFSFTKDTNVQPRDYLSLTERRRIRHAALNYGSIPSYNGLTPSERRRWRSYVAQVLRKPVREVVPDDWDQVNGWKYTSMVWTSLDAGLRPAEAGRAKTSWVDIDNQILRIPVPDSTKNADNWHVSLTERTADALDRWIAERDNYSLYDDTEALWRTREGNPYGSQALRRLLTKLCEHADIDRSMSWYAIRHSVGTYMTREEDLAAAKAQLRHKSIQTTVKYDAAPVEDRRDALNKMG